MNDTVFRIIRRFALPEGEAEAEPYGNGHINDTYRVRIHAADGMHEYILQKINKYVFKHPEQVIDNIASVTQYLRDIVIREGGDPDRETLTLVPSKKGGRMVTDDDGEYWRVYLFIRDSMSLDLPDTEELFELSGKAFGHFQTMLGGFPADTLYESIPDFHNTPARYQQLQDAAEQNLSGRAGEAADELAFCSGYKEEVHTLLNALNAGEIPLRVTHNDTKLNNVLLDVHTGKDICVIDLDTVMPGLAAYDYGDSIRFGASTAAEDERDLDKVQFSLPMFEAFTRGFLSATAGTLNRREIELLPMGAKLMTLECGMRFLADHINGDVYFKIARPGHNLDRARTQFKLVRCMEENWDEINRIIRGYL